MGININQYPFLFNNEKNNIEVNTFLDIFDECVYLYGTDVKYIKIENKNEEPIFGEYLKKILSNSINIRMFMEELSEFGGQSDLYSKFGLKITDEATLYISKRMIKENYGIVPMVGDLIFLEKASKLFEIQHIEDEAPSGFYPLGKNFVLKFSLKMYKYDNQEINSSLDDNIKKIENYIEQEVLKKNNEIELKKNEIVNDDEKEFFN